MSLRFVAKSVIQLISCDICFSIRSSDAAHLESWRIQIFRVKMGKKTCKLWRFKYFHFPSPFPLLIFKQKKTSTNKNLSTPHPFASITAFPVVLLSAGVGATGCGALGITCWSFGGASLSGFSSSTGMPIICALDSSPENFCDKNHPPRGCF